MKTAIPIELPMARVAAFCQRWGIVRLELFGSAVRDDFTDDSDLDFLPTWSEGYRPGLGELKEAESELAQIVGRPVDLVSRRAVEQTPNRLRRESMLATRGRFMQRDPRVREHISTSCGRF